MSGKTFSHPKVTTVNGTDRGQLYLGIYSRVAKSLGVNVATVSRVARRQKTSKRITDALRREYARIDRLIAKERAA